MVTLVSTLHDPDGIYAPFLGKFAAEIAQLYTTQHIVATPKTAQTTLDQFIYHRFDVQLIGTKEIGESRRRAVQLGVNSGANVIHYCDSDRLLYWMMHHPNELKRLLGQLATLEGYACIGRTPTAFATHPPVQIEAEEITNRVCSWVLGEQDKMRDVTAGSCAMSRAAAQSILHHSIEPTNATDCEWPVIVQQVGQLPLTFIETEGLSFETSTFVDFDVFERSHTADNWQARTRLAHDSIKATMRVAAGFYHRGTEVTQVFSRIVIVMGVSGSGKSTIGEALAEKLGVAYYEADDFHPADNVAKMAAGQPLNDDDRAPWLDAIRVKIEDVIGAGKSAVFSASALKKRYREQLRVDDRVQFVYLKGDYDVIWERMEERPSHFMKPHMLQSQFDDLEEPETAITVSIIPTVAEIVEKIELEVTVHPPPPLIPSEGLGEDAGSEW